MRSISFGIASVLAVFTALTVSLPAYKAQAGATSSTSAVLSIPKGLDHIANPNPNDTDKRTKAKGWITGRVTDAVTDAPLAKVQIEVHARIVDKLSDGALSLRSMEKQKESREGSRDKKRSWNEESTRIRCTLS